VQFLVEDPLVDIPSPPTYIYDTEATHKTAVEPCAENTLMNLNEFRKNDCVREERGPLALRCDGPIGAMNSILIFYKAPPRHTKEISLNKWHAYHEAQVNDGFSQRKG
jgi:hypothetical protein